MSVLPSSPLTLNASRICSLIRYPLYSGLLSRGDLGEGGALAGGQLLRYPCAAPTCRCRGWRPGRSRPAARSSPARRRRSSSSFPRPTSRRGTHPGTAGLRGLLADHGVDPLRAVGGHVRSAASPAPARESPKNASTVAWQRPSPIHATRPASWSVTMTRYLPCPLPQDFSSIPIRRSPASRSSPAAASALTRATMFASASQVIRSSAAALRPRHVRRLPRRELLKRPAEPVVMPCPRHRRGDLPVLAADDPRQRRLQERPLPVHVQGPPPHHVVLRRACPRCPHRGHRSRACSSGSTTMISTFSGARSFRGHRSI